MSLEFYRDLASSAAYRADQAARMAAEAADRARVLGPYSVGYALASAEARIAAVCAETAQEAALNTHETDDVEVVAKWANVAQYMADKAMAAAEAARQHAANPDLYR